jgi:hypothetical protein
MKVKLLILMVFSLIMTGCASEPSSSGCKGCNGKGGPSQGEMWESMRK